MEVLSRLRDLDYVRGRLKIQQTRKLRIRPCKSHPPFLFIDCCYLFLLR